MDNVEGVPVFADELDRVALVEGVADVVGLWPQVHPGHVETGLLVAAGRPAGAAEQIQKPRPARTVGDIAGGHHRPPPVVSFSAQTL
ncbi:hypothetical protein GCM10009677_57550 [Sphaerisporangium rubeum]